MLPILNNFLQNLTEGTFPNSLHVASITLIAKPYIIGKKNYRPILVINVDAEILNKILVNQIHQYIKRIVCHDQ